MQTEQLDPALPEAPVLSHNTHQFFLLLLFLLLLIFCLLISLTLLLLLYLLRFTLVSLSQAFQTFLKLKLPGTISFQ